MCIFKSGIILKDRVFVPDYDSHTQMLEELKIEDTQKNAEALFVRAELMPPKNNVFAPVEEWVFRVDQDFIPNWFVREYEEQRMKEAVKKWAETHIHIGKDNLIIDSSSNHYIKDCKNVVIKGSASISKVCGSASISYVCGSASISKVCGSASISKVCGSASISKVCGSAMIASSPYSNWSKKDKVIISENATFKDHQTKTIWQSGDWKVQIINAEGK